MDRQAIKNYLIRGGAWAFAGKVSMALMGLALTALLARLLSPQEMGAYFLAFTLATFLAIPARMGLENTLLRLVSQALARQEYERAKVIIRKSLFLALFATLTISLLFSTWLGSWVALNLFHSPLLSSLSALIAFWLAILAFQFLFGEIFRAFQDIRGAVLFGGLITSAGSVILLLFLWIYSSHATLGKAVAAVLLAGSISSLLAAWALTRKLRALPVDPAKHPWPDYSALLSHSWPLLVNALMYFILTQSDIWVLGAFRSDEDVAIYGAAARLVLLMSMALSIVNAIVPPLIAHYHTEKDKFKLEQILRSTATLAALPSFFILPIFIFFGDLVLEFSFGEFYKNGSTVLAILGIGQLSNVIVGSCGYTLIMTGHQKVIMFISLLCTGLALSTSLFLVQHFGINGVAIGFSIATIIQQLSMLFSAKLLIGVWTHTMLAPPIRLVSIPPA